MRANQLATCANLRRGLASLRAALLVASVLLVGGVVQAEPPPVRALVLADLGDSAGIASIMRAEGWNVTEAELLDLGANDLLSNFEVVWIAGERNSELLHQLGDAELMVFALEGGVLIVGGVGADSIDVAPGGVDAAARSDGAGAVSIAAASHASITGAGIGGASLTSGDLDPTGSGAGASLRDLPEGAVVIARNADGPVVVEYVYGDGHVLVSTLTAPADACTRNVALFAASLIP